MGTTVDRNSSNMGDLVHLTVAVESWMPYVKVEVDPYDGTVSLSGGSMKLVLDELVKAAQASYKLVVPAERGDWGTKLDNGTWTGIIGLLVAKKADIALGPYANTYDRHQAVDSGGMVGFGTEKFLTKYSTTGTAAFSQEDMLLKFKGLDWKIFVCLLVCWCVLPLMCMAIENSFTEFHYYFDFVGAFFGQAVRIVSLKAGIRIVLVSFSMAAMVLGNFINGILHSSMVVKSNDKLIDTYEDLHRAVMSLGLCPVFESSSAVLELFRDACDPLLSDLLVRSKNCNGFVRGTYETPFIKRFKEEDIAYVNGDAGLTAQTRAFCDAYPDLHVHISSEGKFPMAMSFLTTKTMRPHLKRIFSRKMAAIYESGLMIIWVKSAEAEEGGVPCLRSFTSRGDNPHETQASLQVFRGVFQVWGVGLSLSGLALCIEKAISNIKYRRSKALNIRTLNKNS